MAIASPQGSITERFRGQMQARLAAAVATRSAPEQARFLLEKDQMDPGDDRDPRDGVCRNEPVSQSAAGWIALLLKLIAVCTFSNRRSFTVRHFQGRRLIGCARLTFAKIRDHRRTRDASMSTLI
jgi:hypothetical protein